MILPWVKGLEGGKVGGGGGKGGVARSSSAATPCTRSADYAPASNGTQRPVVSASSWEGRRKFWLSNMGWWTVAEGTMRMGSLDFLGEFSCLHSALIQIGW